MTTSLPLRYFAYGSNMITARLVERVGAVTVLGQASVSGYRLAFHKRGKDGSAKCDIVPASDDGARVHGVLFAMHAGQRTLLDGYEGPGYEVHEITVEPADGSAMLRVLTYRARPGHLQAGLLPYAWYKDLVLAGARAHGLPERYIASIEAIEATADPDPARDRRNRTVLGRR